MSFNEKVWKVLKKIPKGKIATYGQIARASGSQLAARAVGNACNKNPFSPKVPCHRVISSSGHIGGYAQGTQKKKKLLEREGIKVKNNKIVNFKQVIVKQSEFV